MRPSLTRLPIFVPARIYTAAVTTGDMQGKSDRKWMLLFFLNVSEAVRKC